MKAQRFEVKTYDDYYESDVGYWVKFHVVDKEITALREQLKEFTDLTNESEGVAGYHLNGDIAKWDELGLSALGGDV